MIWNVTFAPEATVLAGCVTTLNAVRPSPLIATTGVPLRVNPSAPVLAIVKVLVTEEDVRSAVPKSVPSVVLVVVRPLAMALPPVPVTPTTGALVATP